MVSQVKNITEVIGGKFHINPEGEQVSKLSKFWRISQERISKYVIRVIISCLADINGWLSCSEYKILFIEISRNFSKVWKKQKKIEKKKKIKKKNRHKHSNLNVKLKN